MPAGSGARNLNYAWLSLLGFVPSFLAAFGVGEGLSAALGFPPGGPQRPPPWVMLTATVPALLVFALPAVPAFIFGKRAIRAGDHRGRVPIIVAAVVALGFAAMNAAAAFVPGM